MRTVRLWIADVFSGAAVGIGQLIAMRLRRVPAARIVNARISTQAGAAIDRFELVDSRKTKKVTDPERLRQLQARIGKIAGISERSSR